MLTSDLAISYRKRGAVHPRLIPPGDEKYLRDAERLIALFSGAVGGTRGELEAELEEYVGTGTDYRVLRGLIKLLFDRCGFETSAPAEPFDIRREVFLAARAAHPVMPGSKDEEEVFAAAADKLGTDPESVRGTLYADLPEHQVLTAFDEYEPEGLIDRYNLAQAQALLYRCVGMRIEVAPSEPANYRLIFSAIKHFGLIHSIEGDAAAGYRVEITGAASLFHRSQKYGVQMAVFLPALLLAENWEMTAEIDDRKRGPAVYRLTSGQETLVSTHEDEPGFENPLQEKLLADWERSSAGWSIAKNQEVIDLGRTVFIPDLVLISPDGKKRVYLDILGFWTPDLIRKRLAQFEGTDFTNYILAASHELRGTREKTEISDPHLVYFKSVIRPLLLEETAEKLAEQK